MDSSDAKNLHQQANSPYLSSRALCQQGVAIHNKTRILGLGFVVGG
ncbi:hypothetical protein [Helicobacter canis]|nr:hypothetical protein [Helicobacter canis]